MMPGKHRIRDLGAADEAPTSETMPQRHQASTQTPKHDATDASQASGRQAALEVMLHRHHGAAADVDGDADRLGVELGLAEGLGFGEMLGESPGADDTPGDGEAAGGPMPSVVAIVSQ